MGNHTSTKAESLQAKRDISVLQGLLLGCPVAAAQIHTAPHTSVTARWERTEHRLHTLAMTAHTGHQKYGCTHSGALMVQMSSKTGFFSSSIGLLDGLKEQRFYLSARGLTKYPFVWFYRLIYFIPLALSIKITWRLLTAWVIMLLSAPSSPYLEISRSTKIDKYDESKVMIKVGNQKIQKIEVKWGLALKCSENNC